jgi:hypothetical protein
LVASQTRRHALAHSQLDPAGRETEPLRELALAQLWLPVGTPGEWNDYAHDSTLGRLKSSTARNATFFLLYAFAYIITSVLVRRVGEGCLSMTHTIGHFEGPSGNTPGVPCVAGNCLSITHTIGHFEELTGSTPGSALRCGARREPFADNLRSRDITCR